MNTELTTQESDPRKNFEKIVGEILPYLGNNVSNIVLVQVLASLKLSGIVGQELSQQDTHLIKSIQEMVLKTPEKREEAMIVAQKLLG